MIRGLMRAEWLRFRKRRSAVAIVLGVPALVAFLFLAGSQSVNSSYITLDEAAMREQVRQDLTEQGIPPGEIDGMIDEMVAGQRQGYKEQLVQMEIARAAYRFPNSLATILGMSHFAFFALVLLGATMIGDEFGWATVRTTLVASNARRRALAIRLAALVSAAAIVFGSMLLLSVALPIFVAPPSASTVAIPPVSGPGLLALLAGCFVIALTVISVAALATLLVRSGGLTLVAVLVAVAIEIAIQAAFAQMPAFRADGAYAWLPRLLPVRAVVEFLGAGGAAATGARFDFAGDRPPDPNAMWVALATVSAWGFGCLLLAFRRFERMDIAE